MILGKRSNSLSPSEVNLLLKEPLTPELVLIFVAAFRLLPPSPNFPRHVSPVVDPDLVLLQALPRVRREEDLLPVALCLRAGANPNMYVNVPQLGTAHLLGYAFHVTSSRAEPSVLNLLILLLVARGARAIMPMFDPAAGKIRDHDFSTFPSGPTVKEWVDNLVQGDFFLLATAATLKNRVDPGILTTLAILLDDSSILGRPLLENDTPQILRCFSLSLLPLLPVPSEKNSMDYHALVEAVKYFNAPSYTHFLSLGLRPSYFLLNQILLRLSREHQPIPTIALQQIFLSSLDHGSRLDEEQMKIVSGLDEKFLHEVQEHYSLPYWRKLCAGGEKEVSAELHRLAATLNIDPGLNDGAICDNLRTLAAASPTEIKQGAISRQEQQLSSRLARPEEFISGKAPTLTCRNRSLLKRDPFDSNDLSLAYYRDDQGAVWCFPSEMFTELVHKRRNPYNNTSLPDSFLDQVRYQLEALQRLGIDPSSPPSFSSALGNLSDKDSANNVLSDEAITRTISLAEKYGIMPEMIYSMPIPLMTDILADVGYPLDLGMLTPPHALISFSRAVDEIATREPMKLGRIFSSISRSR